MVDQLECSVRVFIVLKTVIQLPFSRWYYMSFRYAPTQEPNMQTCHP
jgi:hypothetical protein